MSKRRRSPAAFRVVGGGAALALLLSGCTPGRPTAPPVLSSAELEAPAIPPPALRPETVRAVRVISPSISWALATDDSFIYYGDATQNALAFAPKSGGPSTTIAAGAPWSIGLTARAVVWVATPGDRVLAAPLPPIAAARPTSTEILGGATYTALAVDGERVLVAEARGERASVIELSSITNAPAVTRLADLPGIVRALAISRDDAFAQTDDGIYRVPRGGGAPSRILAGLGVTGLATDDDSVFTTLTLGPTQTLVRVPREGGSLAVLEHGVRGAPIAAFGPSVFYVDADQPTLRVVARDGGASTIVMRAPSLASLISLVVDGTGIYAGTGGRDGSVLALPLPAADAGFELRPPGPPLPLP